MSSLVIVESPTKAKTLSKFLGKEYTIAASKGHIRDLPKKGLGVDVENNFEPDYEIPDKSKKVVTELKKALKDSDSVVLATDLDREGEAIAWHLKHILSSTKEGKQKKYERVVFHEITEDAIREAFENKGIVNENLFNAQQARRVLDRLVGYKLSPLLWKKVRYGLSAGRVQSVAVRLIVEREEERRKFKPEEYWSIDVDYKNSKKAYFKATLTKINGKKADINNEKTSEEVVSDLKSAQHKITDVKKSEKQRKQPAPFKTSTLQQTAANAFGYSAKKTMGAAQKLFEKGLITYHRTDSLNLSPKFTSDARAFISKSFGKEFIPEKAIYYKSGGKNTQEAHEAIHVTTMNPGAADSLTSEEKKIYALIFKRSLECQMMPAVYDQTSITVETNKSHELKAVGSVIKFYGWLQVGNYLGISDSTENLVELPEVVTGEGVDVQKISPEQHFTQPPPRYSDATLIKAMEEMGVGRPSTYAPTIATIQSRKYVEKDGRYFVPTEVAFVVTNLFKEHIPEIIDYDFTADMEEKLDNVADGDIEWQKIVGDFYRPFEKVVMQKDKELHKADVTKLEETNEKCPKCGRHLNVKLGKYGKFLSCSGYPDHCDFAKPMDGEGVDDNGEVQTFGDCDQCDDGKMVLKQGRYGKFYACTNYPKCKNTKPYLDKIGIKCPKCEEGEIVRKKAKGRTFFGCSRYPDCDYSSWKNPMQANEVEDDS